ncbi:HEAT repeat domain-containing protein [Synechococcus sp. MIT S1220]|uniref:HEAT repeat domain-containing protein n=1 Tax=Synechococcus sp. MIT S1220 TaxID=3082549 RepID=UPI0039B1060A
MQNVLLPVVAIALGAGLLIWRRPTRPLLRSTDVSDVAELNRAQLELVIETSTASDPQDSPEPVTWQPPATARERCMLQNKLRLCMDQGPDQRLEAVRMAALWGGAQALPVLRRGLRDSDSRVVIESAAAIESLRSVRAIQPAPSARPPRNVARMR